MNGYPSSQAGSNGTVRRACVACAAWLLAGFIGASAVAGGLLQLVDGGARPLTVLILTLCGGALAVVGWHRAETILDRVEQAKRTVGASSATSAGA